MLQELKAASRLILTLTVAFALFSQSYAETVGGGALCVPNPIKTYMDITLDPQAQKANVFVYEKDSAYNKVGIANGLVLIVNQSKPDQEIYYAVTGDDPNTNDYTKKKGWISVHYDPYADGCIDYWFIYCPQGKDALRGDDTGKMRRQMCLNGTGISEVKINEVPTPFPPQSFPEAQAQRRHLLSHNELYLCNKKPGDYAPLCWPLMLILGLLLAASFAAGRNPFMAFDLSSPRLSRGRQYAMRQQQMSFDFLSYAFALEKASNAAGEFAGKKFSLFEEVGGLIDKGVNKLFGKPEGDEKKKSGVSNGSISVADSRGRGGGGTKKDGDAKGDQKTAAQETGGARADPRSTAIFLGGAGAHQGFIDFLKDPKKKLKEAKERGEKAWDNLAKQFEGKNFLQALWLVIQKMLNLEKMDFSSIKKGILSVINLYETIDKISTFLKMYGAFGESLGFRGRGLGKGIGSFERFKNNFLTFQIGRGSGHRFNLGDVAGWVQTRGESMPMGMNQLIGSLFGRTISEIYGFLKTTDLGSKTETVGYVSDQLGIALVKNRQEENKWDFVATEEIKIGDKTYSKGSVIDPKDLESYLQSKGVNAELISQLKERVVSTETLTNSGFKAEYVSIEIKDGRVIIEKSDENKYKEYCSALLDNKEAFFDRLAQYYKNEIKWAELTSRELTAEEKDMLDKFNKLKEEISKLERAKDGIEKLSGEVKTYEDLQKILSDLNLNGIKLGQSDFNKKEEYEKYEGVLNKYENLKNLTGTGDLSEEHKKEVNNLIEEIKGLGLSGIIGGQIEKKTGDFRNFDSDRIHELADRQMEQVRVGTLGSLAANLKSQIESLSRIVNATNMDTIITESIVFGRLEAAERNYAQVINYADALGANGVGGCIYDYSKMSEEEKKVEKAGLEAQVKKIEEEMKVLAPGSEEYAGKLNELMETKIKIEILDKTGKEESKDELALSLSNFSYAQLKLAENLQSISNATSVLVGITEVAGYFGDVSGNISKATNGIISLCNEDLDSLAKGNPSNSFSYFYSAMYGQISGIWRDAMGEDNEYTEQQRKNISFAIGYAMNSVGNSGLLLNLALRANGGNYIEEGKTADLTGIDLSKKENEDEIIKTAAISLDKKFAQTEYDERWTDEISKAKKLLEKVKQLNYQDPDAKYFAENALVELYNIEKKMEVCSDSYVRKKVGTEWYWQTGFMDPYGSPLHNAIMNAEIYQDANLRRKPAFSFGLPPTPFSNYAEIAYGKDQINKVEREINEYMDGLGKKIEELGKKKEN